jgi:hypothetical protein
MTNPWQNWLEALTQAGNNAASSSNPALTAYNQGWQQWAATMANAWQSPSEFWQTVSAIQTVRAQSISQFWQQQPQQFATLISCQSWPQACGHLTQWCGNNAIQAINLSVTTQAYRANLWQQWSRNLQPPQPQQSFNGPQAVTSLWAELPTASAQPAAPQASPKSAPQPGVTPAAAKASASQPAAAPTSTAKAINTPAEATATTPWHMQSHYPTQHLTSGSQSNTSAAAPAKQQAAAKPQPQPVAKPAPQTTVAQQHPQQESMPLMNGTTGTPTHSTTSSTANSVMRTNGGSITSAAAATRRSVVARRASGRRRVVPRTVR